MYGKSKYFVRICSVLCIICVCFTSVDVYATNMEIGVEELDNTENNALNEETENQDGEAESTPDTVEESGDKNSENDIPESETVDEGDEEQFTFYTQSNGWVQSNGKWYYYENGVMVTGWKQVNGKWYYMDSNGVMQTGFKYINGSRYYMDSNGVMQTGWIKYQTGGTEYCYYADSDGAFVTGWKQISGSWYLFAGDGEMLTGWQYDAGKWYYMNLSGQWVNTSQINNAEANTIKGMDVSYWQGNIDWQTIKDYGVIKYSFIRVGRGVQDNGYYHVKDTKFEDNIRSANAVGIPSGVYVYSKARTPEQAVADAQFAIQQVQGYSISYPIVIDIEDESTQGDLTGVQLAEIANAFATEIRNAGYTPMLYCNENWYKNKIDSSRLGNMERWIARYNGYYSTSISRGIWQSGSTCRLPGINGNIDINFALKDYSKIITPRTYVATGYVPGSSAYNGWVYVSGKWYYYYSGELCCGWKKIDGRYYFFDENTGEMRTGWIQFGNKRYYFDSNGRMVTGWCNLGGYYYYFGDENDGVMKTGWTKLNSKYYYFEDNGKMASGWRYLSGKWYYFGANSDGTMKSGWQCISGKWYYLGESNDGAMRTGWIYLSGKWYYLNNSGAMATGWCSVSGSKYYFGNSNDGVMKTDWQYIGGKWYYFGNENDGAMKRGWVRLYGKWYYLNSSGIMVTGYNTIDGVRYYFNSNGVLE